MKRLFTLVLFAVAFSPSIFAQQFGHLTIFSEDGDKFFLVLNGEKINEFAQTNLRVEELTQPYYNAKIIFEDESKTPISKNYLEIADIDGIFSDVTYKIKRDKNNSTRMKLNFFSMAPVVESYIPPRNVVVMQYGNPVPVSQTISHTTTTVQSDNVNAGINVNGMGVNISVNAPGFGSTVTETTTVSTSTSGTTQHQAPLTGCQSGRPMQSQNFATAVQAIKNQKFSDTQFNAAKQVVKSNCMSASQIAEVCKVFSFEDSKLAFAKYAYDFCIDTPNYFKVIEVFTFSSSVDELNEFIDNK